MRHTKKYFEDLARKHGKGWESMGFTHKASHEASKRQLAKWLKIEDPLQGKYDISVLDIGCGTGEFLDFLEELGYNVVEYSGVDPIPSMLEAAEERAGNRGVEFATSIDDLSGARYDLVLVMNVFSYWLDSFLELKAMFARYVHYAGEHSIDGFAINCISQFADWLAEGNKPIPCDLAIPLVKQQTERVMVDLSECPHLMFMGANHHTSQWRKEWQDRLEDS